VDIDGSLKLSGRLEVGGRVDVSGEITVKSIEIGGVLRARKAAAEDRVEVGGSITTGEGVKARIIEIGKRGEAHGPLRADEVLVGRDAHVETVSGREVILRTGASAENVYGESVTIESHCHIHGEVQYTGELRLGEKVSLTKTPVKVDKLPF
jgi:cytoskeletal protein CcmA (bactofilin family)